MQLRDKGPAKADWHKRFDNRAKPRAGEQPRGGKLEVKAAGDTTELMLYDEVGFWGVTAAQFKTALDAVTTPKILLRINSPGGDVFDGYAIFNLLKAAKKPIDVVVDGLAASAASYIALAGDTVTMKDPAMMMIHRAWTVAFGNANDMTATAAVLAKVDGQIADIYAAKSGKPAKDMLALMDAETWLTAQEAGELGLIDQVDDPDEDGDDDGSEEGDDDMDAKAKAARMRAARLVQLGIRPDAKIT